MKKIIGLLMFVSCCFPLLAQSSRETYRHPSLLEALELLIEKTSQNVPLQDPSMEAQNGNKKLERQNQNRELKTELSKKESSQNK